MSHFEFIFTLFSLLLGLSLVELISGLGRTLKAYLHTDQKAAIAAGYRIGWLTPLLGLFVMLDLLSFWSAAWLVRDMAVVSGAMLMGTMLFASLYYLAAHLVFPDHIPSNGDLDPHYYQVRRPVLGILIALIFIQLGFYASQPELLPILKNPLSISMTIALLAMMSALCWVRATWLNLALLAVLVARYIFIYLR